MENKFELLNDVKCYLLDMDGTIYLDDVLFENVAKTINIMRQKGRIIFLTNNSSKSAKVYIEKLKRLGISITDEEIYTSGMATCEYLNYHFKNKSVGLLGTEALKEEFIAHNITIDEINPDICVLGYDSELTYKKLCDFTNMLHGNCKYIATHPDINCPSSPYFVPDIGAMIEMIYASTLRRPEIIIGKPYKIMGENIMAKYNLKANEIAMIGDRLYTDIAFANNCNFVSILVLSGESTIEDYKKSKQKADIIIDKISALIDVL